MGRVDHVPVEIRSRDYWYKALENQQTNWALIDEDSTGAHCVVYFFHELSGVFDRLSFPSQGMAASALRFNGFRRSAEWESAPAGWEPKPPFFEDRHPNGPIYSSGRYWKQHPEWRESQD